MNEIRWKRPLVSIEHLYAGGVGYVTDYFDEEKFRYDIMDANDCGEPVCVVLYHDENGKRLLQSVEWVNDIDCPAISAREDPVPPVQDRNSTYEIYQIPATEDSADYLFRPYEQAKEQLSAKDYACVYAAPLEPGMTLDSIFDRHNRNDRPAAQTMRSLSVSDVVVVRGRQGAQAFYVDSIGFQEVPQLAKMLDWLKKKEAQKNQAIRNPSHRPAER